MALPDELNSEWDVVLLGAIFREEKRQMFVKRLLRQVRKEFISEDFKRLQHYKEVLMNLDAVKALESAPELAQKIHRQLKTDFWRLREQAQSAEFGSLGALPPASPQPQSKEFRFESSIMNLSNTLGLKPQGGALLSTLENDPKLLLEQRKQRLLACFEDNLVYFQNRHVKGQGACLHFLNSLHLQKRFSKLLHYDFRFAREIPQNLGVSFYDPLVKDNVLLVFFPRGTPIPTRPVARAFQTKSEVIKLKILEGGAFLSQNCRCIEEFEIKLMDTIDQQDGFCIQMQIDPRSILTLAICNRNRVLFEIQLLYKVRSPEIRLRARLRLRGPGPARAQREVEGRPSRPRGRARAQKRKARFGSVRGNGRGKHLLGRALSRQPRLRPATRPPRPAGVCGESFAGRQVPPNQGHFGVHSERRRLRSARRRDVPVLGAPKPAPGAAPSQGARQVLRPLARRPQAARRSRGG